MISFGSTRLQKAEVHYEDCFYVPQFLQRYLGFDPKQLFHLIDTTAPWRSPTHVPLNSTPIINYLVEMLQQLSIDNNALHRVTAVHCSRSGNDEVSYHSEEDGSNQVLLLSLGKVREFHIAPHDDLDNPAIFVLDPGDLVILGPHSYLTHQHALAPEEEEQIIDRQQISPHIALTFQSIQKH